MATKITCQAPHCLQWPTRMNLMGVLDLTAHAPYGGILKNLEDFF
ncbi:hypothetical protein [Holospora elegans]|nr:hypothetical protein [Holospora elegans]